MPKSKNVARFVSEGMIEKPGVLSANAQGVLDELTDEEVDQLVDMWKRLGKPEPPDPPCDMIWV